MPDIILSGDALRAAIVAEARTWQKTPYLHQGRVKGVGTDCCMYILEVCERVGFAPHHELVDEITGPNQILKYPGDWMMHNDEERILPIVEKWAHPVAIPGDGDFILYRYGKTISHGGIVDVWPRILHAYKPSKMVEYATGNAGELAFDKKGKSRIHGFYSVVT